MENNYCFFEADPYIKRMERLSRRAIRRYLCRGPENYYPLSLYKFRSIDRNKLRPFIIDNEFYLSSRTQFNDPFDATMHPVISTSGSRRMEWARAVARNVGASYKDRKRFERQMHDPAIAERRINASINQSLDNAGIFSFAGDPRDILMWSHYAESHRGVCLRYDITLDVETFVRALPVEYSEEYPVIDVIGEDISMNLIKTVLRRKAPHWSYERERRLVEPSMARKLVLHKPAALTHVIYGCKASPDDIALVRSMLHERELRGYPRPKEWYAIKSGNRFSVGIFSTQSPPSGWAGRSTQPPVLA